MHSTLGKAILLTIVIFVFALSLSFADTTDVSIIGLTPPYYSPGSTLVKVGDSITWTNTDNMMPAHKHTVVSDNDVWAADTLSFGGTFTYTFTSAGMYPYHCNQPLHSVMHATAYVYLAVTVDTTPPNNVTNLSIDGGDTFVSLGWTKPTNADFLGTRILRKQGGFPSGPNDGTASQIYQSNGTTFNDGSLTNGLTYYYGAFSYDTANNFASGTFGVGLPHGTSAPSLSKVPDIRLKITESLNTAINLNDFNSGGAITSYTAGANFGNATIDSQGRISFGNATIAGQGIGTYSGTNSGGSSTTSNVIKYSTYRFNIAKKTRVYVDNGTLVGGLNGNSVFNLTDFITPTASDSIYFNAVVIPLNAADSGKVQVTISNKTIGSISLTTTTPLVDEVIMYLTVSPDSTLVGSDFDTQIGYVDEVLHDFSQFNQGSDTTQYAFENAPLVVGGQPAVTWLPTFNGESGVLKFEYTGTGRGIKLTLQRANWIPAIAGKWYTLRMKVCSDQTVSNSLNATGFIYNGEVPSPTEVSGIVQFNLSTSWSILEISVKAEDTTALFPQLIMKNGSSLGSIYLDSIEVVKAEPGIILAHGNTKFGPPSGTWDNSTALNSWAIESLPNSTLPSYTVITGLLDVNTNGSGTQGIKLTAISGPGLSYSQGVSAGEGVGMQMKVSSSGTLTNPIFLLALFGDNTLGGTGIKELGATAAIFRLPAGTNGIFQLGYNVMANPFVYPQFQVKNGGNAHIYVDDTLLLIDRDIPQYFDDSLIP